MSQNPSATLLLVAVLLFGILGAAVPLSACEPVTIQELWDNSGSVHEQALKQVQAQLQERVLDYPCAKAVEVQGFASIHDVLGSTPTVVPLTWSRLNKEQLCGKKSETVGGWEDERQAYEAKCDEKLRRATAEDRGRLMHGLVQAVRKIDFTRDAPQSCIYHAIAKALAEPASVRPIFITDLKNENCDYRPGPIKPLFGSPGGARPIIIVVPSRTDSDPIGAMERRISEIRERAPGVTVIPYTQVRTLFRK